MPQFLARFGIAFGEAEAVKAMDMKRSLRAFGDTLVSEEDAVFEYFGVKEAAELRAAKSELKYFVTDA